MACYQHLTRSMSGPKARFHEASNGLRSSSLLRCSCETVTSVTSCHEITGRTLAFAHPSVQRHRRRSRRLECPLHERAQVGHVVAGKVHAAIWLLERGQRLERRRRLLTPGAAVPWHARPRDGERGFELGRILRMNAAACLERDALTLRRRPLAHLPVEVEEESDQHAFRRLEAVRRIKDLA